MSNIFSNIFGSKKQTASTLPQSVKPENTKVIVTGKEVGTSKTVIIGTQEWTAENLNVEHYRNGDTIPQVQDKDKWAFLTTGAWCYYENKTSNGKTFGKLYNWYAINDSRELAPVGWHVPSDAEWTKLTDNLGGITQEMNMGSVVHWYIEVAGGKLKATTLWNSPNTGATNESGFTAFPGGARLSNGYFYAIGGNGFFWSASAYDNYDALIRDLNSDDSGVYRHSFDKGSGYSVRCVRD